MDSPPAAGAQSLRLSPPPARRRRPRRPTSRCCSPRLPAENYVQCREARQEAGAAAPLLQGGDQVPVSDDEARCAAACGPREGAAAVGCRPCGAACGLCCTLQCAWPSVLAWVAAKPRENKESGWSSHGACSRLQRTVQPNGMRRLGECSMLRQQRTQLQPSRLFRAACQQARQHAAIVAQHSEQSWFSRAAAAAAAAADGSSSSSSSRRQQQQQQAAAAAGSSGHCGWQPTVALRHRALKAARLAAWSRGSPASSPLHPRCRRRLHRRVRVCGQPPLGQDRGGAERPVRGSAGGGARGGARVAGWPGCPGLCSGAGPAERRRCCALLARPCRRRCCGKQ